eukprot:GHRQ01026438.1.p1 GENE.GHRQ01026438.1~~GHRQ01026438.1.p1  ORF type:complete len:113 (+),score=3.85 GHRQ01026438.1:541-879(+)
MATFTDVKPLLPVQDPVPADIDIAQSITPKHISQIAEVGLSLLPEEYELYGPTKAKVGLCVGRLLRIWHRHSAPLSKQQTPTSAAIGQETAFTLSASIVEAMLACRQNQAAP